MAFRFKVHEGLSDVRVHDESHLPSVRRNWVHASKEIHRTIL